jgi:ribose transport system permease protein
LRSELTKLAGRGERIDAIAAGAVPASWPLVHQLAEKFPQFAHVQIVAPHDYYWPTFLMPTNLLSVAHQVAVSAIVAIGMTMVIITGGIDLSVGSLLALSAVFTAWVIEQFGGGAAATLGWMILGSLCGIALCAACGLFSGFMVTFFRIPAFIVTLAMLLIARGTAHKLSADQPITALPASFKWLGTGSHFGIPHAVLLMLVLYAVAYVVMSRTTLGRYIYAIGGNAQAARLSGVRVERVTLLVYTLGGALAGLGGVILCSQFNSGDPTFGPLFELQVIAAVVVGGASLNGGQGKILGTLIGTLFIGVINNGMNILNIESNSQTIALGVVILGAVLLDTLKNQSWRRG